MNETKHLWKRPVLTKVELRFDKEMVTSCHGSSQPSSNAPQGCGKQGAYSCWVAATAPPSK